MGRHPRERRGKKQCTEYTADANVAFLINMLMMKPLSHSKNKYALNRQVGSFISFLHHYHNLTFTSWTQAKAA